MTKEFIKVTKYLLSDFHILRPQYETSQEKGIEWLALAHAKAEMRSKGEKESKHAHFVEQFTRIGCKPEHINQRGHELPDFLHSEWLDMEIFQLDQYPQGAGLKARQKIHSKAVEAAFEKFYSEKTIAPANIIHVSCTGYESPSPAQKIVSRRGWGEQTRVTHAYHMGCYASVPAIRMGCAFVNQQGGQADIVHTELCTLHFNPANHNPDQIVLQSLFADGYIKYTVEKSDAIKPATMQVVAEHEMLIPDCLEAMTWQLDDFGFEGTLSKKIPFLIARNIRYFMDIFAKKAGLRTEDLLQTALFAIHPGGPKILDQIQEMLTLSNDQLFYSREVLRKYGNISSGTLPHIWQAIAADDAVASGTPVMGLAFGPGLNIAGALLIKQ